MPVQAKQQSQIEALLDQGGRDNDLGLGIGIKVYDEGKGRGIVAQKHFSKGDFIVEYAGELVKDSEAKQRNKEYDAQKCTIYQLNFLEMWRVKKWCCHYPLLVAR